MPPGGTLNKKYISCNNLSQGKSHNQIEKKGRGRTETIFLRSW